MADETSKAVDAAAEGAKAANNAAAETVKAGTQAAGDTAKAATKASKRASVRTAKATQTANRKITSRAKAQRRARNTARKPEAATANERNSNMNFDNTNWFAGLGNFQPASFQTLFAEAGDRGQQAIRRSQQAAEELADITRANVEALVDAGRIAAEGARSIGQDVVETSRDGIEQTAEQVRLLAEVRSATEFVQLQGDFARSAFDRMVAESSRLTESLVKLAGEAIQPISNRASVNAERLNKIVA